MNIDNITNIAGSIIYQNIFKNKYFENGYNLFLSEADKNDEMFESLMNTYQRKYTDNLNNDFIFVAEEYMDLYIKDDSTSKNSDITEHCSIYYPSTLQHNLLFFYGLEKHFDKLWYAYFDMSDYNYIFVDMNFNNQFKLSYLIDKINSFDEKNIYLKKIEQMDFDNQNYITCGYFYTKRRNI